MKVGNLYIEDTYAEAFTGIYSRFIVTTHPSRLNKAKEGLGLPSVVVGRTEGGVEKWLGGYETPDGRTGFIAQVWGMSTGDMEKDSKKFYKELCIRIRQGILVVPTTKIYNACDNELIIGSFDMMDGVGYCGDKYSREVDEYGRRMINVPIMFGRISGLRSILDIALVYLGATYGIFVRIRMQH